MSLFKWSSDYSVYLPEIDAEHRAIYRLGDELHKALLAGADADQLKPILANLLESAEAALPPRRASDARHALQRAGVAQEAARRGAQESEGRWRSAWQRAIGRRRRIAEVPLEWLRDHISVADRMMGAYLRNYLCFNTSLAS